MDVFRPTLLFTSMAAFLTAGIYAYVGWLLSQRRLADPEARRANHMFMAWWLALAAATGIGGVNNLLGSIGYDSLPAFVALTYMSLLFICIALCGLLYYLIYLFTGSSKVLAPLVVAYALYYGFLIYIITYSHPIGVQVDRWRTTLEYQIPITGPIFVIALSLLVLPQIVGALAYFTLFFRVRDSTQKYRILLVSWSIVVWFGSAFLVALAGLSQYDWWQIASRVIGLAAVFAILLAYRPPDWIKRRFSVLSVVEEGV